MLAKKLVLVTKDKELLDEELGADLDSHNEMMVQTLIKGVSIAQCQSDEQTRKKWGILDELDKITKHKTPKLVISVDDYNTLVTLWNGALPRLDAVNVGRGWIRAVDQVIKDVEDVEVKEK